MTTYRITGFFTSNRTLTDDEVAVLSCRLNLELEEPIDMDSERVDWVRTGDFDITITPVDLPAQAEPDTETLSQKEADTFDMDELTRLLLERGVSAYVEQTGGGCATIYIGNVINDYYELAAGPGWFDGPAWTLPRGQWGDFYYGPDDDGDSVAEAVSDPVPLTQLADDIVTYLQRRRTGRTSS